MFRYFFSILQGYVVLSAAFVCGEELPPIHFNPDEQCSSFQNVFGYNPSLRGAEKGSDSSIFLCQILPNGQIYSDYLAYTNASRLGGVWNHDEDLGWLWDINLGGRSGLFRYGNKSAVQPEGFQIDIEGNVHLRLDLNDYSNGHSMDMDANDFRFGMPFSWGNKFHQIRTGYYHTSSHLGDERIIRLLESGSEHQRINYVREAWILAYAYKPTQNTRLYAEADFALDTGEETEPWHFLFGAEYSNPYRAGSLAGSPFAALHVTLLQEHNYDGNVTLQTGWQWRGKNNQMFRIGLQYFGGVSEQYEHIRRNREHKFGIGLWYDF